jgi:putative phosphoribosyl transferase
MTRYQDRSSAGRLLGAELGKLGLKRPVVLALPRGGVPVAAEVAKALAAPLDLVLVRKVGAPWQPELAIGSVADGPAPDIVFNDDILKAMGMTHKQVEDAAKPELREIDRRRALYLKDRAPVALEGREAVLVDDGVATGATLKVAIKAVRRRSPSRVIVAAPVGAPDSVAELRRVADDVVCLSAPEGFYAIGQYYDDFHQLTDAEVAELMGAAPPDDADASASQA